ncbi:hypothetical protein ACJIZ3_025337 [Penstemon smallii]|uniref:Uncharacterized protein n=1 Tax=Penstemon smallii TaxID=265156 RepID=A0ABD3TVP5_9LAMI
MFSNWWKKKKKVVGALLAGALAFLIESIAQETDLHNSTAVSKLEGLATSIEAAYKNTSNARHRLILSDHLHKALQDLDTTLKFQPRDLSGVSLSSVKN